MPSYSPRQAALWFASKGHAVLPLHSIGDAGRCTCGRIDCGSPGKHPVADLVPNGLRNATTDSTTIKSWFADRYWLSYGVTTDNFLVIDVDKRDNGLERWHKMHSEPTRFLPTTWEAKTGSGGKHVYFTAVDGIRNGSLDKGIDLKSRNGYVVGPGCKHASGGEYHWLPQSSPADAQLADPPAWLISLIRTRTHAGKTIPVQEWRRYAREIVQDGERHTVALKMIGRLVFAGLDEEFVREIILAWNDSRCDPPLSPTDVMSMVENVCSRERQKLDWLRTAVDSGRG
jgi:hypothetical protein